MDFLARREKTELMTKLKIFLMELLNKSVLMNKTKQRLASLKQMQPFISQIGEQEFKENLLPVINKSLLRSPEIALSVVSVILSSLRFDLSSFSADLGPTFCSNLKSKDDATREDAVEAVKALAMKSSDAAAIEKLFETKDKTINNKHSYYHIRWQIQTSSKEVDQN